MNNLPVDDNNKLLRFTWPGGYPVIYLDKKDNVLCPDCAQKALDNIEETNKPVHGDIYYEGAPLTCEDCNTEIESAYGDPDES